MTAVIHLSVAMLLGLCKASCANELTYLPIGATPGVSATSLLGNDDGGMAVASLIFPFYNGVATSAFVSVNGVISFGGEVLASPQTSGNSFPNDSSSRVLAPFWSNNDIRSEGTIRFEVYDRNSGDDSGSVLDSVSDAIANQTGEAFRGTWMLLAEWANCHPYPHGQSGQSMDSYLQQENTYQAIAITDSVARSYAVFIYECGGVNWGANAAIGSIFARVGVSIGVEVLFSHPLSGNESIDTIDCVNNHTSRWMNLIYDISLVAPASTTSSSSFTHVPSNSTTDIIISSLSAPLPSQSITKSGSVDHTDVIQPTSVTNHLQNDTPTEIIIVAVVLTLVAGGLAVVTISLSVLVFIIKKHKKTMKVVDQSIIEVKLNQSNLSLSSSLSDVK